MSQDDLPDIDGPFDKLIGLHVVEASADRVVAVLPVTADLLQAHGIVHGGVYATLVETTASVGAFLWLDGSAVPVGIANHTEFLRAVRQGATLRAAATPVSRGRSTQLWQVAVVDEHDRLVAQGQVRLMNLRDSLGPAGTPSPPPAGPPPAAEPPPGARAAKR